MPSNDPRTLAIVGYGHFGQFIHTLQKNFAPAVETVVVSSRPHPGVTRVSLAEAAACDAVVLCVPIATYEATVAELAPLLRPHTIVVDVATVKEVTEQACRTHLGNQPYICTHPMFGPASYAKSGQTLHDLRIVVTAHTLPGTGYAALCAWAEQLGLVLIEMDAAAHDRYLAETLFLTHYIAQTITAAGFVRTDIDTVSFGFLLDAVESVRDDRKLFADVYAHNRYCQSTIDRWEAAAEAVQEHLQEHRETLDK